MRPNYLEAFYYVGKWGGVAQAARHIPHRIGMPAISMHISALEDHLGTRLFERRPFALTPAGQKLFDHCRAFFDRLPSLENELREDNGRHLGIGAPEVVLRDYLTEPIDLVRKQFPQSELSLVDGDQASLEELLRRREISVAVTIFDTKPSEDFCSLPLLELPLVLVVPARSKWKAAEELWKNKKPTETFLLLPPKHAITQNFRDGLKQRGIHKFPVLKVDTTELIETYVRSGHGLGVTVAAPGLQKIKGLRFLQLNDFPPVTFGLLWQQSPNALMTAFIEAVQAGCARLKKLQ